MLLDTSAWIEFFEGTDKGNTVLDALKNNDTYTSVIAFGELVSWYLKKNIRYEKYLNGIKSSSKILEIDETTAILAGRINHERKKSIKNWGLADSLLLSTSIIYDLQILTTDNHFKGLPNAVII